MKNKLDVSFSLNADYLTLNVAIVLKVINFPDRDKIFYMLYILLVAAAFGKNIFISQHEGIQYFQLIKI